MVRTEKLGRTAAVKATMLQAHLEWGMERAPDLHARLQPLVPAECLAHVERALLATDWIPFRCLVAIDRGIATAVGGGSEHVYRELGRHSATLNLGGVYKSFVVEEPHRFFEQASLLHGRFQNFGRAAYERTGERSGRLRFEGYEEWSPVYCSSALGYFTEALRLMNVPSPPTGAETSCQCAGDPACLFELSW